MKTLKAAAPLWIAVLWVAVPLFWNRFFTGPYLFANLTGLQDWRVIGPVFFALVAWAMILSIPRFQTVKAFYSAGGFFLAVGWIFSYYEVFARTGWYLFFWFGIYLLKYSFDNEKQIDSPSHGVPEAGQ